PLNWRESWTVKGARVFSGAVINLEASFNSSGSDSKTGASISGINSYRRRIIWAGNRPLPSLSLIGQHTPTYSYAVLKARHMGKLQSFHSCFQCFLKHSKTHHFFTNHFHRLI